MRFHCGISFSWRTIKKYLIPILIGLFTAFGFGFLGVIDVNADTNVYEVYPDSIYYLNLSTSPYTFYPNVGTSGDYYQFYPVNTGSNAYNFTLEYDLSSYITSSTNIANFGISTMLYSTNMGGLISSVMVSVNYIDGSSSPSYTSNVDNGVVNVNINDLDLSKPFKIVYNSTYLYKIDNFYFLKTINLDYVTIPEPELCPDCPDCPDGNYCEDNTVHSEFSNYVYYFDDRTTTNGLLSNIYILLFLYCIGMLTLKFINIVRNTRWK